MDVKQLRVGNWVNERIISKCGLELMPRKVTAKDIGTVSLSGEIDSLEPIPLTIEILEKCNRLPFKIRVSAIGFFFDYGDSYQLPVNLDYFHDLQNLHLDLTKTELECNI